MLEGSFGVKILLIVRLIFAVEALLVVEFIPSETFGSYLLKVGKNLSVW